MDVRRNRRYVRRGRERSEDKEKGTSGGEEKEESRKKN